MKRPVPRSPGDPLVASCRFDKNGPPPECKFKVCGTAKGKRFHADMRSEPYPYQSDVHIDPPRECDGWECRGWFKVTSHAQECECRKCTGGGNMPVTPFRFHNVEIGE